MLSAFTSSISSGGEEILSAGVDDFLRMTAELQGLQFFGRARTPGGEVRVHVLDKGGKLGVHMDGGFDLALVD